MSTNIKMLQ